MSINIDELGLVPVERARAASAKAVNEPFQLRRFVGNKQVRFTIEKDFFEQSGLIVNSGKPFKNATDIFFAVLPGNSGTLLRNTKKGKQKGRGFKSDELEEALQSQGKVASRYKFELYGEKEGQTYYKVLPLPERPKRVKKVKTEVAEQAPVAAPTTGIATEPTTVQA